MRYRHFREINTTNALIKLKKQATTAFNTNINNNSVSDNSHNTFKSQEYIIIGLQR